MCFSLTFENGSDSMCNVLFDVGPKWNEEKAKNDFEFRHLNCILE
jgi:hypothetical protein